VKHLVRLLQRLAIFGLGALSIWLIIDVFDWVDADLPWILALAVTYGLAAYVILPYAVRMGLKVLQHRHVPRFTITGDGLPGDPVNLALIGTVDALRKGFAKAGWQQTDPLSLQSCWRMAKTFVLNQPYPTAPFSTLYLFGRAQDIGFQKAIGDSPRKRHHVRFWAKALAEADKVDDRFWLNTDRPDENAKVLWVGAGTKDTGFSLTRLTFQMTHATDSDTNAERDYIMGVLRDGGAIGAVTMYEAGDRLSAGTVNHYVTDGDVAIATLDGGGG
jgi:LssY-like putative type I secretion system component LssY